LEIRIGEGVAPLRGKEVREEVIKKERQFGNIKNYGVQEVMA